MTSDRDSIEMGSNLPALIARLRIENQCLHQENRDLQLLLATIAEHGDFMAAELQTANHKLQAEVRDRSRAERTLWALVNAIAIQNTDLEIIIQTLTEHGDALDRQWFQKYTEASELVGIDGLTQIPNRRQFDRCLDRQWQQMGETRQPLGLVMCDIDAFKSYNDTYGHPVGDVCLKQVAIALRTCLHRPTDLAARYGGEEFAVLLPQTDLQGATSVALRVQAAVRDLNIPHTNSPVSQIVTVSMGVASVTPEPSQATSQLLRMADERLYKAKRQGRSRIVNT